MKDISEQVFGSWTALFRLPNKNEEQMWQCRCICGREKGIFYKNLIRRKSTSCKDCSAHRRSENIKARLVMGGRIRFYPGDSIRTTSLKWVPAFRDAVIKKQNGLCPICGKPLSENTKELCFDHDHTTLLSRGVIHRGCNMFLGFIECNPGMVERAQNYLKEYSA